MKTADPQVAQGTPAVNKPAPKGKCCEIECIICKVKFWVWPSLRKTAKLCSYRCLRQHELIKKLKLRSEPTPEQLSKLPSGARLISLPHGNFTMVDEADFERLNQWFWHLDKLGYVSRMGKINGKARPIKLHREVLLVPKGYVTDHANGNRSDNRRSNLRVATHSQNSCNRGAGKSNRSGYKGVFFDKRKGMWIALIAHQRKTNRLGSFPTPELAAEAYRSAAMRLHGEFAHF